MDLIFKAPRDPTRRALLDALRVKNGQSPQELEALSDLTRFGVMKHIGRLEEVGLLIPRKVGRFKCHYLNPMNLQDIMDHWVAPFLQPQAHAHAALNLQQERDTLGKTGFHDADGYPLPPRRALGRADQGRCLSAL